MRDSVLCQHLHAAVVCTHPRHASVVLAVHNSVVATLLAPGTQRHPCLGHIRRRSCAFPACRPSNGRPHLVPPALLRRCDDLQRPRHPASAASTAPRFFPLPAFSQWYPATFRTHPTVFSTVLSRRPRTNLWNVPTKSCYPARDFNQISVTLITVSTPNPASSDYFVLSPQPINQKSDPPKKTSNLLVLGARTWLTSPRITGTP